MLSIALAMTLLLSSVGLTYGTHYCGGHAVVEALMIGQHELDCGMAMMDMAETHDELTLSAPDCCSNHYISASTDEANKKESTIKSFSQLVAVTIAQVLYLVYPATLSDTPFKAYTPPLIHPDLQLQLQVFLI